MAKSTKTYEERIAEKDAKIEQSQKAKKKIMQQHRATERKARDIRVMIAFYSVALHLYSIFIISTVSLMCVSEVKIPLILFKIE